MTLSGLPSDLVAGRGIFVKIQHQVFLALSVLAASTPLYAAATILDSKRGLGDTGANYADLQATNAGWYYTWGTSPASPGTYNAAFYPMFWSAPSQNTINTTLTTNPQYILGFNEPDVSTQSNMTVAQAITSWTTISSTTVTYNANHGTNIQLVSPAVSDTSAGEAWLKSFMSQATTAGLKVDAVAFHWYDDDTTNGAQAATDFENKVVAYHNAYNKPVFITEFADHDWSGTLGTAAMIAANTQMLNIVIPWLDSQSFVAGYSYYNWFSDSATFATSGSIDNPTSLGASYDGSVGSGVTFDVGGQDIGEHVADLSGGTLTMSTTGTVRYINALSSTSSITGAINWGLNASTNWVRIQPAATLDKTGTNTITFAAPVSDDGTLQIAGGVLSVSSAMSGAGSINISSTGDATGSTARIELNGNVNYPQAITFAQRNDPAGSDGIRNVSGNNTLSGPITIVAGGNQARVTSNAGLLTLAGRISTNATSSRNFYLQGTGNGVVSGVIADNAASSAGNINLFKQGTGTWTLTAANTYTGNTTINAGTLQLAQVASTTVMNSAVANYTFDSVTGSTVANSGTGGATLNGTLTAGATVVAGGRFGNALSVAGGAYLNVISTITPLANTGNWTVSAWVKTATPGSTILSKSNGGWASGNTIFYLGDGNSAGSGSTPSAVRWGGGFDQTTASAPSVTDNNWHLLTYVSNAGNYAIYVDGTAEALSDGNNAFGNADVGSNLRIGATTDTAASDGTVNFNGLLDNVQIYNQALTAPQISALFLGTSTGALPSASNVTISTGATLDVNSTVQQIGSLNGSAGSTITLGSGQLITNSATNSAFAGVISGNGGSIVKQGIGTLTLSAANSYTGGTTVSAGALIVADPHALGTGPLTIHANATSQLQSGLSSAVLLPAITLDGFTNNWSGSLDITNNKFVIEPTSGAKSLALATLQNQTATHNITSSTLAADFALAVIDNGSLATPFITFGGQFVDPGSILIAPELLGDANADGSVDLNDLNMVLSNLGTTNANWTAGNFDNAATIDLTDLNDVLNDLGLTTANAGSIANAQSPVTTSAPEPASLLLLAAAPLLLRRRK
jgi:autotransporter-associated beta strand protein